jgi:hypothetical protein
MNIIHFIISYVILQRAVGHTVAYVSLEILKSALYLTCLGISSTVALGTKLVFNRVKPDYYYTAPLDDVDFEYEEKTDDDYIVIDSVIGKKE